MKNFTCYENGVKVEAYSDKLIIKSESAKIIFDKDGRIISVETDQIDDETLKIGMVMSNIIAQENNSKVELSVIKMLREIGIPSNLLGYQYIKTAILLAYEEEVYLKAIVKGLYVKIAKIYNTTPTGVERAIRHSIEVVWRYGNRELIDEMFAYTINPDRGTATNSQFLSTMVEKIKQQQVV